MTKMMANQVKYFRILLVVFTMLLVGSSYSYSQCEGPVNGGDPNFLSIMNPTFSSTVDSEDFTFTQTSSPGPINISSSTGLEFLVDPIKPLQVKRVLLHEDITMGTYSPGPLLVYNNASHTGPFGGGAGGFIAIKKDGRFGWIELGECGSTFCNPGVFEFPILERCLNGVAGGTILAGNSGALSARPASTIPTMSEWALIILALLLISIGLVSIRTMVFNKMSA